MATDNHEYLSGKVHELNLEKLTFGPMSFEEVQARTIYVLRAVHYYEDLLGTMEWTLMQLEDLTTEQYSRGGDKAIRGKLQEILAKVRGQA